MMTDKKTFLQEGDVERYNASDLSTRYKEKEKRTVITERKAVSLFKNAWNSVTTFLLLAAACAAVYGLLNPSVRNTVYHIYELFRNELGI